MLFRSAYLDGDLAERHPINKAFLVDPGEAPGLYASRAVSPTGPMYGPEMRWPERAARAREEALLQGSGLQLSDFARARDLARGTRRALRMVLEALEVSVEPGATGAGPTLRLAFTLPAGGYATAVLREFRKSDTEGSIHPGSSSPTGDGPEADARSLGQGSGDEGASEA